MDHFMYYKWGGVRGQRVPVPAYFNETGIFDSHIHISYMDLRILILGNSLSDQLAGGLEEALCYDDYNFTAIVEEPSEKRQHSLCFTHSVNATNSKLWVKNPRITHSPLPSKGFLAHLFTYEPTIYNDDMWSHKNTEISQFKDALALHPGDPSKNTSNNSQPHSSLLDVFVHQFISGHFDYMKSTWKLLFLPQATHFKQIQLYLQPLVG